MNELESLQAKCDSMQRVMEAAAHAQVSGDDGKGGKRQRSEPQVVRGGWMDKCAAFVTAYAWKNWKTCRELETEFKRGESFKLALTDKGYYGW